MHLPSSLPVADTGPCMFQGRAGVAAHVSAELIRTMASAAKCCLPTLLFCLALQAANIPITVVGATETQIVVNYTATTDSACAITAVDNNNGPAVNDVDATKFTGANYDISDGVVQGRTSTNGFRWPTITLGRNRTVVIGGHDEVKQGLDGAWYSTALQANSPHIITVSCNSGADIGTITAKTSNIPLASYYPELMIPQPTFFGDGSWPQPTIDYSVAGRAKKYIDPITGVLITRMSDGLDNLNDGGCCGAMTVFTANTLALDPASAWTNPQYGTTSSTTPSNYASTSTPNAALFLPIVGGMSGGYSLSDYRVQLFGKGSSGAEIVGVCITKDSGQTCASGEIQVPMSTSSGCQTYLTNSSACEGIPNMRTNSGTLVYTGSTGTFPQGQMSDWGGGLKNSYAGTYELINSFDGPISNVSVSGSTLTANSNNVPGFNVGRTAGSLLYLSGCTTGGPTALLHVSTVDVYNQVTVQETGKNLAGCTYQDLAAGIRIVLKNSGTVQVAALVTHEEGRGGSQNSNGVRWLCARSKVTDISTDCDGNAQNPPLSGFLCSLDGNQSIYLVQDNGRVCLQSNGYGNATAGHVIFPASPFLTNNTAVAQAYGGGAVYALQFPRLSGNYTEYQPGLLHNTSQPDNATYTPMGVQASNVNSLVAAATGASPEVVKAVKSGIWGNPTFQTPVDIPGGNTGILWGWYAPSSGGDGLCMFAVTDAVTNSLLSTYATWNNVNGAASSACHGSPFAIDGYNVVNVQGNANGSPAPNKYSTSAVLGGPFVSRGLGLHRPDGSFHTWTLPAITGATNASPVVLTFASVTDLDNVGATNPNNGVWATCAGGTGSWAGLNGAVYLHNPSTAMGAANTTASVYTDRIGQIPLNSSSWGSFTGQSITCSVLPPVYGFALYNFYGASGFNSGVTGAANSGYMRVTPNTTDNGFLRNYPSKHIPIQDGDPIALTGTGLTTQYYAKVSCTGCQASGTVNVAGNTVTLVSGTSFSSGWVNGTQIVINGNATPISAVSSGSSLTTYSNLGTLTGVPYTVQQVDIYTDSALTHPLAYSSALANQIANGYIAYAETCPDPGTLNTSWIFMDSGIGTSGHPLVRCITVRLNSEPCSDYASAGEQASYPCPSDPSNTSRSSLHNINIGDGFQGLSHLASGAYHEIRSVVSENKASESQIDVTMERWYGDIVGRGESNGVCGYISPCNQDNYANSDSPGWQLWQITNQLSYAFQVTQLNSPAIPSTVGIGHNDLAYGPTPGNVSYAGGDLYPGKDSIFNVPMAAMMNNITTQTTNNYPVWNGDTSSPISDSKCFGGCEENYTNARQVPGLASTTDFNWFSNWTANNPDGGHYENAEEGIASRTLTKIRGTTYDSGSATNLVYKITPVGSITAATIKTFPLMIVSGVHQYMSDKSGPGSLITDADLGKYCVAYVAGECRPNSAVGDVFVAMRGFMETNGQCVSSNNTLPVPCAVVPSPGGGWAIQQRINPPTYDGSGIRRMTLGFHAPLEAGDYSNWLISPDAHWGFFAIAPVNAHAHYQGQEDMHWWMMKLPPWPDNPEAETLTPHALDKRMTFVQHQVRVPGQTGDMVRIAFGYGENGGPPNLFCTSRQETCWTSASPTTANPFLFASETQQKTACSNGCWVPVPAIPGRVLFYQIETQRNSGATVVLSPIHAEAIP